jgi:hypothetical protein
MRRIGGPKNIVSQLDPTILGHALLVSQRQFIANEVVFFMGLLSCGVACYLAGHIEGFREGRIEGRCDGRIEGHRNGFGLGFASAKIIYEGSVFDAEPSDTYTMAKGALVYSDRVKAEIRSLQSQVAFFKAKEMSDQDTKEQCEPEGKSKELQVTNTPK